MIPIIAVIQALFDILTIIFAQNMKPMLRKSYAWSEIRAQTDGTALRDLLFRFSQLWLDVSKEKPSLLWASQRMENGYV